MILNNEEINKIRDKTSKVFDSLIVNTNNEYISEIEKDVKYNELVDEILYLVEEIVDKRYKKG